MAAPPFLPRTVPYLGLITLPFRTFTTSYVPINGSWNFNPNSYSPMEFHGFAAGGVPIGIWARLISLSAGPYTDLKVGNVTLANDHNNIFQQGCWQNGRLGGFAYGLNPFDDNPASYDYPLVPGVPLTYANFYPNAGIHIVPGTNTGSPQPSGGVNFPVGQGYNEVMTSSIISLAPHYYIEANGGGGSDNGGGLDLGVANNFSLTNGIGANVAAIGTGVGTWVHAGNPTDITDRGQLLFTDWRQGVVRYTITFENPPGGTDIDNLMTQTLASYTTTASGFVVVSKAQGTFGTVTTNFAVFVLPDFSGYFILALLPTDATAAALFGLTGNIEAKMDDTGALWFKNVNGSTNLYVTNRAYDRLLPLFPPVPLPNEIDRDPVVRLVRSLAP